MMRTFIDKFLRSPSRRPAVVSTLLLCLTMVMRQASPAMGTYIITVDESHFSDDNDSNDGSSFTVPTIQGALDIVQPGDVVEIMAGRYYENVVTKVHGRAGDRITIRAQGGLRHREDVILHGSGADGRVMEINHDFYTIEAFTIDGEARSDPDDDSYSEAYRDILLYARGTEERYERDGGYLSALDGLIIRDMNIKNAGGECIRLRYFVTHAEIHDNKISNCGIYAFVYDGGGKNGEGIYVGTSSNQWDDGKNPTEEADDCAHNLISNNIITTNGNEGIEVKEGSLHTTIEYNQVYNQLDSESAGICTRSDFTIIRYNHVENAEGAGIRIGGHKVDNYQWGVNNEVYENDIVDCQAYGVKIMTHPQRKVCDNSIDIPAGADIDDYAYSGGSYGGDYDPEESCS